jgi:hypothetical protein
MVVTWGKNIPRNLKTTPEAGCSWLRMRPSTKRSRHTRGKKESMKKKAVDAASEAQPLR